MIDVIVFSKDRAFQLHTLLETLQKHVIGINNIFVQFGYTSDEYYNGYQKLREATPSNVEFIDETKYGFSNTLRAVISSEISSEIVMVETDDSIFIRDIDISRCANDMNVDSRIGRYGYQTDYKLFGDNYESIEDKYVLVNKTKFVQKRNIIEHCLQYSFNVGGSLCRREDILQLVLDNDIIHPVDLEWKGADSEIFKRYSHNMLNKNECSIMMHLNNVLGRYEQVIVPNVLNDLILEGEVMDISNIDITSIDRDMRWFNGEDIGRFPIFPWEIPPKFHKTLIDNRKSL
jgi:hypothetical protein